MAGRPCTAPRVPRHQTGDSGNTGQPALLRPAFAERLFWHPTPPQWTRHQISCPGIYPTCMDPFPEQAIRAKQDVRHCFRPAFARTPVLANGARESISWRVRPGSDPCQTPARPSQSASRAATSSGLSCGSAWPASSHHDDRRVRVAVAEALLATSRPICPVERRRSGRVRRGRRRPDRRRGVLFRSPVPESGHRRPRSRAPRRSKPFDRRGGAHDEVPLELGALRVVERRPTTPSSRTTAPFRHPVLAGHDRTDQREPGDTGRMSGCNRSRHVAAEGVPQEQDRPCRRLLRPAAGRRGRAPHPAS